MSVIAPACISERIWDIIRAHCDREDLLEKIHTHAKSLVEEWGKLFRDNYTGLPTGIRVETQIKTGGLPVERKVVNGLIVCLVMQDPNKRYYYCTLTRYITIYLDERSKAEDVTYGGVEPYIVRERRR